MSGPGDMERLMKEISRLMGEREFDSEEEMKAFLTERVTGRTVDEIAGDDRPRDPLDQAQEMMYDAWETPTKRDRVRMAEAALEISPDCADAYALLAEEKARSAAEARAYWEESVRAGERALGDKFTEYDGHFWGFHQTRPYMRARAGLAETLWQLGRSEEAFGHWREMLRLNPSDNQGIRYVLLTRLLEADDQDGAGALLDQYDDAAASWLYDRALWFFRTEGAGPAANAALREAVEQNPHVPEYVLGRKRVPARAPDMIGWGDVSEAKAYAVFGRTSWQATPGALPWLNRRGT